MRISTGQRVSDKRVIEREAVREQRERKCEFSTRQRVSDKRVIEREAVRE